MELIFGPWVRLIFSGDRSAWGATMRAPRRPPVPRLDDEPGPVALPSGRGQLPEPSPLELFRWPGSMIRESGGREDRRGKAVLSRSFLPPGLRAPSRAGAGSFHAAESVRGDEPGSAGSERRRSWERRLTRARASCGRRVLRTGCLARIDPWRSCRPVWRAGRPCPPMSPHVPKDAPSPGRAVGIEARPQVGEREKVPGAGPGSIDIRAEEAP